MSVESLRYILDYCEFEKRGFDDPGSYEPTEYYIKCKAKSDILEEVISLIKRTIEEDLKEQSNNHD